MKVGIAAENDDFHLWKLTKDGMNQLDAVHFRHFDVRNQHIRVQMAHGLQRLLAVAFLRSHNKIRVNCLYF